MKGLKDRMTECIVDHDREVAHLTADDILCSLVVLLVEDVDQDTMQLANDIVLKFREMDKWYA